MAKKSGHTLLWPPRYRSGDLRNLARVPAGALFRMRLKGWDFPVRKLRRSGYSLEVTIPPQVWETLQLEPGHYLLFGATPLPGVAVISRETEQDSELLDTIKREDLGLVARKVTCHNRSLRVGIPQAVCEFLSAEIGDYLTFGLTTVSNVLSLCAAKGGGDSAGSGRPG